MAAIFSDSALLAKTYMYPMIPIGKTDDDAELMECRICERDHLFRMDAIKPGYQPRYFVRDYFDWLVYTKFMKIKEKENNGSTC